MTSTTTSFQLLSTLPTNTITQQSSQTSSSVLPLDQTILSVVPTNTITQQLVTTKPTDGQHSTMTVMVLPSSVAPVPSSGALPVIVAVAVLVVLLVITATVTTIIIMALVIRYKKQNKSKNLNGISKHEEGAVKTLLNPVYAGMEHEMWSTDICIYNFMHANG